MHDVLRAPTERRRAISYPLEELRALLTEVNENYYPDYEQSPEYREYLVLEKGLADADAAPVLTRIGDSLSTKNYPQLLHAAGWAYAESALITSAPVDEKLAQLEQAKLAWQEAIILHDRLQGTAFDRFAEYVDLPYRYALSLAMEPLMASIAIGNISRFVKTGVYKNVLDLAEIVIAKQTALLAKGERRDSNLLGGFVHELCIILTAMNANDIGEPLPASVRSGSGKYRPNETHDISLIELCDGKIIGSSAVEGKYEIKKSDIERYDATIICKADLVPEPMRTEAELIKALRACYNENPSPHQHSITTQAVARLRKKINETKEPRKHTEATVDTRRTLGVRTSGVLGQIARRTCIEVVA